MLYAFARLDRRGLHLVILGEGSEQANLRRLARDLGIGGRVHLPGHVSDVDNWYRSAECFVLSSRYEGLVNVLLEAMANGCPVISFDCPYGPSEIIDNGKTGLLVADGDMDALAAAMTRILTDDRLRADLAANAMVSITAFDVENIAPRWLA